MHHHSSLPICLASVALLGFSVVAEAKPVAKNPYATIARRNIFGLRPPPPALPPSPPPPAPLPLVTLQGITTLLPGKRALIKVALPAQPSKPAKLESFVLAEGQKEGNVKIMKIDADAGSVTAEIYGHIMELNFEKNGAKLNPAPPPKLILRRQLLPVAIRRR